MTDPMIPGLEVAVAAAVNELRLTYNEGPGDLYDLVHDALTAAYPHLIEPAIKAAREEMRERCAMAVPLRSDDGFEEPWDNGYNAAIEDAVSIIHALPLTEPTEPPEAAYPHLLAPAVREVDATVAYEVTDHHGDWAASADTLTEAIHYLSVYGQDGPVKLWKVTSVRVEMLMI